MLTWFSEPPEGADTSEACNPEALGANCVVYQLTNTGPGPELYLNPIPREGVSAVAVSDNVFGRSSEVNAASCFNSQLNVMQLGERVLEDRLIPLFHLAGTE